MPDVFGVQRPRLVHVTGAFDDGTAVGEDCELMAFRGKLEEKAIEAHRAERRQVPGHFLEIEPGRLPLRHLYGVAATEAGSLRALLTFEPFKVSPLTARAIYLAQKGRDFDPAKRIFPDIDVDELPA